MAERPHCRDRAACAAKGQGHCRPCHMLGVVRPKAATPEARERLRAGVAASFPPERRAEISARMKRDWADPSRRVEIVALLTAPETRLRHRAGMKAVHARPESRARVAAQLAAARACKRTRAAARAAVKAAGLPLLRKTVNQAVRLLAAGLGKASVSEALKTEWGRG